MLKVGLIKTTLIDFPGEVASSLFLPGCNLRCPYCHNPTFVSPPFEKDLLTLNEALDFLKSRRNVISGVCITGGEPLIHKELQDLIERVRSLGLKIKLDTNGTFPEKLKKVKPDYIALDIKTIPSRYGSLLSYSEIGQPEKLDERVLHTLDYIVKSGAPHEIRTTVVPGIVNPEDIAIIADLIKEADRWVLQQFNPHNTLHPDLQAVEPYPRKTLEEFKLIAEKKGLNCTIRSSGEGI